jgi:hypothetical protein
MGVFSLEWRVVFAAMARIRNQYHRECMKFNDARDNGLSVIMAGCVPAIYALPVAAPKTRMPGSSPGMTST